MNDEKIYRFTRKELDDYVSKCAHDLIRACIKDGLLFAPKGITWWYENSTDSSLEEAATRD